jgi:hypothetical protein
MSSYQIAKQLINTGLKKHSRTLTLTLVLILVGSATQAAEDKEISGTFALDKEGFLHVKKVEISKTKEGKFKARVTLAGFPDDIPLGEQTLESYVDRDASHKGDAKFTASFSNNKLSESIQIEHGTTWLNYPDISVTSFLKYADGRPSLTFRDLLKRELVTPN